MWASSNLGADAFLMVYDITSRDSLDALEYFTDLIDMEAETRIDNAHRAKRAGLSPTFQGNGMTLGYGHSGSSGPAPAAKMVPPVQIVAGNKCDLQESRQVPAAQGLDWARRKGCGFMETSARVEVNIEETFALIVRRVVEARRLAEMGILDDTNLDKRGMTKPLRPLPSPDPEKRAPGVRGPNIRSQKVGRGGGAFWRKLRCW